MTKAGGGKHHCFDDQWALSLFGCWYNPCMLSAASACAYCPHSLPLTPSPSASFPIQSLLHVSSSSPQSVPSSLPLLPQASKNCYFPHPQVLLQPLILVLPLFSLYLVPRPCPSPSTHSLSVVAPSAPSASCLNLPSTFSFHLCCYSLGAPTSAPSCNLSCYAYASTAQNTFSKPF